MKIRPDFKIVIGLVPILIVGSAFAQPSIDDTQGVFNHGESVTILGSGFGTKSPAAPMRYDNFEDGQEGEYLLDQGEGGWYTVNNTPGVFATPTYNRDRQRVPGEQVAFQDFSDARAATIGLKGINANHIYMSGWCYRDDYEGTASLSENQKMWGNFGKSGSQPQARMDSYWSTDRGHIYATDENGALAEADWSMGNEQTKRFGRWFRMERYMRAGTGNGNDLSWVSAHEMGQTADRFGEIRGDFFSQGNSGYDYWILGHYLARTNGAHIKVYMGEIYLDNTLARVEIGDNPNFEACTHREIQVPSGWDNNTITFTGNLGTFSSGEDVYLFVVNANDQASSGHPVTLGEGVPMVGPGQPGQPEKEE